MSYLAPLRLHFSGKFQASVSTYNNDRENFDIQKFDPRTDPSWNPAGDGDWRLIGCRVTAAWHGDGTAADASDPVLRCLVADTDRRAPAKLVDLDTDQQGVSTIFGMEVRIADEAGATLVRGEFTAAPFTDLWQRWSSGRGDPSFAATYQSVITDVDWADVSASKWLTELRERTADRALSVKFNVDGFTADNQAPEFTLGRVVGTLGATDPDEPRFMLRARQFVAPNPFPAALNTCQAIVARPARKVLVDVGNALPTTASGGALIDQGPLHLTCSEGSGERLDLGEIPYRAAGFYEKTAGICALPAERDLTDAELAAVAGSDLQLDLPQAKGGAISLPEVPGGLYVRADEFVFRLYPGESVETKVYATERGEPWPGVGLTAYLSPTDLTPPNNQPAAAIDFPGSLTTGGDGTATLRISAMDPGNPREFIDGQVYSVRVDSPETRAASYPKNGFNFVSVLIWDVFHTADPPTWSDLEPVLKQYANLYPVMARFLNLADRSDLARHREMLIHSFGLPIGDPNSMPVVRDMSPAKRAAIVRWLSARGEDGLPLMGEAPADAAPPPRPRAVAPRPAGERRRDKSTYIESVWRRRGAGPGTPGQ